MILNTAVVKDNFGRLNVAVIAESAERAIDPDADGQGFVVPPQFARVRLPLCALHPSNVEPEFGVAVILYVSLFLNLNVPLPPHVVKLVLPGAVQPNVAVSGLSPVPILANVTVPPPVPALVKVMVLLVAAILYGPTNGPPFPNGAVPAGWISLVLVSSIARATLTRPLPVCSCVPAAAALSAMRFTITPFDSDGSTARIKAALPATIAAEAEVPLQAT